MPNANQQQEALDRLYSDHAASDVLEDCQILVATVIGQALVDIGKRLDSIDDRLASIREELPR
ncbi:MAG TPA: hypothetical protein VN845_08875 [Solirubrobacteraceae bacterium]|nr:hypothetical protein [Solirubrobacteraceae bacterium]